MIKNIIFDFGGVLLNLDYELTFEALSELLGMDLKSKKMPSKIQKILNEYEKGEMNKETFLWNLQKASKLKTPQPNTLIKAWNKMLLGWNPERFEFLKKLRKNYNVYLLSNTNDLHIEWVMRDLKRTHNIHDFDETYFDKTFYSHKMGMRKPDIEIYQQVIKETKINPQESLFIDDNADNVKGAKKAGLHAVLHNPENEIMDVLKGYIKEVKK